MNNIKKLLEANYNLILTGAPGTGKTYLAWEIANEITHDTKDTPQEKRHSFFVQFHPSYDYTDFVEGLRPTQPDENGNIGFVRQDGIFKTFCKKALEASHTNFQDNFEESWQKLIDQLNENEFIQVSKLSGNGHFDIEFNVTGSGLVSRNYISEENKQKHDWDEKGSKFFNKGQLYNIYRGQPGVPTRAHDNYRRAIIKLMKKDFGLLDYNPGTQSSKNIQNYVFIIDEINRGDIAKIFGELFFALDPGYRGKEEYRVQTQYNKLIEEGDLFKNGFYIPRNVYIIGTMNDIDRNVESMDFAIRRRFTWKKITPEITQEAILSNLKDSLAHEAKRRMDSINKVIRDAEQLGENFCIGASYFMKLGNGISWDELWELYLFPLLEEYVRGLPNAHDTIKELKEAYELIQQTSEK